MLQHTRLWMLVSGEPFRQVASLAVLLVGTFIIAGCSSEGATAGEEVRDIEGYEDLVGCTGCRVVVATPMYLDTTRLPGFNRRSKLSILEDDGGALRLAYGPTAVDGQIVVTSPNPSEPPQMLGKHGEGPGEFLRIRTVAFAGPESLVVLESSTFSVLSLRDSVATKVPLAPGVQSFEIVVVGEGDLLAVNSHAPTRKRVVVQQFNGLPVAEFLGSALQPGETMDNLGPTEYHLAVAGDGTLIGVPKQERWEISRWTTLGDSVAGGFLPQPDWFIPHSSAQVIAAREANDTSALEAFTFILDVEVVGGRYLLVAGRVPDARTRPEGFEEDPAPANYKYDTMLDVYDLHTNRLISRLRFDVLYSFVLRGGYLARYLEDADGFISVSLRRVTVTSD